MAEIKIKCGSCGHEFFMQDWETKSCPNCGKVTSGKGSGTHEIKVKCGSCGHEFFMQDWETKSCPKCGRVAKG